MPATVFTLCDLPSFGYGLNSTSVEMLSSQLLAVWARAHFYHNNVPTQDQLDNFMILFDPVIKESKTWIPLQAVVTRLKQELTKSSQVSIFKFAYLVFLSVVADAAGDGLPAANAKLAENISLRFTHLYLDN
ncbi:hypothetical protein HPULCUR_011844 [Helicostylum pulchrum]|uniref:Uncharacterized protein n=1 Tax=Helicostylum pulchrum TaxID=562976 RepID=A0ABP9YH85_9FUNG